VTHVGNDDVFSFMMQVAEGSDDVAVLATGLRNLVSQQTL
jgi:hypothetical protein